MQTESRTFKALFQPAQKRTEILRNEVYSVYPVVALVEGVLHASNSPAPELALAAEFGALPSAWDGSPVVLSHPVINGRPVSANNPEVFGQSTMGFMYNTRLEDRKLKSEIWVNRKWATENGQQGILDILDGGGSLEVSTGLFANVESRPGMHDGQPYAGIWRNVMPDHLAILPPGSVGACSIEDGCGIPRINQDGGTSMTQQDPAVPGAPTEPEVKGASNGCACEGTKQNAEGQGNATEEKVLSKIASAIAKFLSLDTPGSFTPPETPAAAPAEPVAAAAEPTTPAAPQGEQPKTLGEFIEAAPEQFRSELKDLVALRDNSRKALSDQVLACTTNTFSEDELKALSIPQLEKLVALSKVKPEPSTAPEPADFSGRGASRDSGQGADPGYTAPMLVFPRKTA
jgi:hypothetical protein